MTREFHFAAANPQMAASAFNASDLARNVVALGPTFEGYGSTLIEKQTMDRCPLISSPPPPSHMHRQSVQLVVVVPPSCSYTIYVQL